MPTYDYECDGCGHTFELFQSISAEPQKKCPQCKKSKLRRLFGTGAALMFKGSGFYQTDYRSESYKKAAAAESKPAESTASGGKGDSGKSDAGKSSAASGASSAAKPASASKPESGKSS